MSKNVCVHPPTRSSVSSPRGAVAVRAPSRGRAQVLRSGQPGMDAGLAAHGHGWPIAAGPRSRTGARACRAQARHRTTGARALGYLAPGGVPFFQVTRRQGGTLGGRYSSNGYVPRKKMVGCQVAIAAMRRPDKPALQRDLAQAEVELPFTPVKATKKIRCLNRYRIFRIQCRQRITSRRYQKFAGVFALIISASSAPILRNRWGNVVGK